MMIKPIPAFEGYFATSDGIILTTRVRFQDEKGRVCWATGTEKRPLRTHRGARGRRRVEVRVNGVPRKHFVHSLVLFAFNGPRPTDMEACHNNGDAADNRIENLRWDTRQNNIRDKVIHGTQAKGERVAGAKLTAAEVRFIRMSLRDGVQKRFLASTFGVTPETIGQIDRKETWRHVTSGGWDMQEVLG